MTSFKTVILTSVVSGLLLTGNAFAGTSDSSDVVGPEPAASSNIGQLIVYTATHEVSDGNDDWAYPHTGYFIDRMDGSRYKYVANHISRTDSEPDTVDLPSGEYYIVAEAGFAPSVRIPVRIVPRRTTIVNLEHGVANKVPAGADPKTIIHGPHGIVIGWMAAR
jgi:hypothetical protein